MYKNTKNGTYHSTNVSWIQHMMSYVFRPLQNAAKEGTLICVLKTLGFIIE